MPFRGSAVEDRIALFREFETGVFTVTELCARHNISRTTFYEWKERRDGGDPRWFEERSHGTVSCPHRTSTAIAARIIALRERHPQLGPKKIRARLADKHLGIA
jgi:hypothetical protein